ncbi:MAG: SIS domain-containing protein, partial [Anaerolineae bacterium]|nr:SIS domain-containing protein [Anaerolineae bacterium]
MTAQWDKILTDHPKLSACSDQVNAAFQLLHTTATAGGKILTCGNGGSAADSEHIVGELMKGFTLQRPVGAELRTRLITSYGEDGAWMADHMQLAIPAISLVSQTALMTAFLNDVDPIMLFAQQVLGYGQPDDCLIALSTSGNSANVVNAVRVAKV